MRRRPRPYFTIMVLYAMLAAAVLAFFLPLHIASPPLPPPSPPHQPFQPTFGFPPAPEEPLLIIHRHVDFAVYLNSRRLDFRKPKYDARDPLIHLHTGNENGGTVIHIEGGYGTLGRFFSSLGMSLTPTCFFTETEEFCTSPGKKLQFFVNDKERSEYDAYEPQDLDRILISYGASETELARQIESVSSDACLYSEKCPERLPAGAGEILTL